MQRSECASRTIDLEILAPASRSEGWATELDDSWFETRRPTSDAPPARHRSEPPIGDPIADAWFL